MVAQLVTVALRVRAMGSRTAIANGILVYMKPIHLDARRFDLHAKNFQRMTPSEKALGRGGLYRFYDTEQRPLYVGISVSFEIRWDAHRLNAQWWPRAAFVAVSFYPIGGRTSVQWAESAAITRERPVFNKQCRSFPVQNLRRLAPPPPRFPDGE